MIYLKCDRAIIREMMFRLGASINRLSSLCLCLALFGFHPGVKADAERCTRRAPVLEGDWVYHHNGEFIFAYALTGPHVMGGQDSMRDSLMPHEVSDASLQLNTVREILARLDFQLPLDSYRYQSQGATRILVRFQNIRYGGFAYDEVTRLPTGECVLTMVLSTHLPAGNATPAHEYFHLVQNGYAMFKRAWYYEGLARWAESSVSTRRMKLRALNDESDIKSLWGESYTAETGWNSLINSCGPLELDPAIFDSSVAAVYSDGVPVVTDRSWLGVPFVRLLLEELAKVSSKLSMELSFSLFNWPERLQKSGFFDRDIWSAVERACELSGGVMVPGNAPDFHGLQK